MGVRRVQVRPVIICLLISFLAFGCGGDTPSPSQNTSALASALIRAADGGAVTVPSPHPLAGTSIALPPGALDSDTIISIFAAPLPALPGVMGLAIDLQPDGTAFRLPVTVTLVYNDADLPAGTREERLSIAKVDTNGTLVPLTNVRVDTAANMVRGETTSLSVYVLVLPSNTAPNTAPVANAGPDQTVVVGHTVTLDGSHSTDVDGDRLQYQWSLVGRPSGSQAALADPTLVLPTFIVDRPGSYTVRLIVNDGKVNSASDTVTITTTNTFPVANAGPDQTVFVRTTVHLDGSMSSDVDGDALQFAWSLTISPSGSSATLSDPTVVNPTFVANKPGAYVVQLLVNDGIGDSAPASVTITTINSRPVANAGPDQMVVLGQSVPLDGSTSNDVDADRLTFLWSVLSQPPGGVPITLSDPTAVNPTFVANLPGTYVVQLIVPDGTEESLPDTVVVTTQNTRPVANAGPDQSVSVTNTVHLDGSASNDRDGDPLRYRWSFTSAPAGSTATLLAPTVVNPSFVVDLPGIYVAQLMVNDGQLDSAPDTVVITTENARPVANAGPDQTVVVGTTVHLDGSTSNNVDGDRLTFRWALTAVPSGSTATLSDPTPVNPAFVVDKPGTYIARLIVNDGAVDSAPATVTITTANSRPMANAGPDQTVLIGSTVQLDGSASSDADGDALRYRWSLITVPVGSRATLSDSAAVQPSFVADLPGTYVAQLIVNDGAVDSLPDTAMITTANRPPVLAPIGNRTIGLGDTLVLQLTATDPDRDPLTFSVDPLPANASLDATTGRFTFTPGANQVGTLVLTFKVSDGKLTDEKPITVTVVECQPPAITAVDPLTCPVGTEVTITGTNLNCGTAQTLTLNGVPAVITSLSPTELKTFIPLGGQDGLFAFSTPGGTVTAPQTSVFDVVVSRDFALAVAPGSAQALQGAATTYTVELQRLGSTSFTPRSRGMGSLAAFVSRRGFVP